MCDWLDYRFLCPLGGEGASEIHKGLHHWNTWQEDYSQSVMNQTLIASHTLIIFDVCFLTHVALNFTHDTSG